MKTKQSHQRDSSSTTNTGNKLVRTNGGQCVVDTMEWTGGIGSDGKPKKTFRNAREAILMLGIVCRRDTFHNRMTVAGEPIGQWVGELTDDVVMMLRQIIIEYFDFDPGKEHVSDAASSLCIENPYNPMADYLDSLKWDGTPRVEKWLTTYLGAQDTPLNSAFGKLTLVAAVRRVRWPGCKFDQIPVLEGEEGSGKSTAIEVLAGTTNFSDQTILTASDKEQQELVSGVWLYEIADLAGMRCGEVEKIKAFASRTTDRARPAYGRRREDKKRTCIFIGTTNDSEYLQSETGNRRFWPVETGVIDIEALRRDRDQLWAEAVAIENTLIPLALPKELREVAKFEQDERRHHEPWDDVLADVKGLIMTNEAGVPEERIASDIIMRDYLQMPPGRMQRNDAMRLRRVMKRLGWSGPKKMRFGDASKRGYYRSVQR